MSTDRPRYTVSVDDEMFEQIENFRFENRYKTRSQATVELIRLGIEQLMQTKPDLFDSNDSAAQTLTTDERQLIEDYRSLNKDGQEYIRHTMFMVKQTHKKIPNLSNMEKQA